VTTEAPAPKRQPETQVRLPLELRETLKQIADRDGKKLHRVTEEAVREYVEKYA